MLKNKKLWKRFNLSNVANVAGAGTRNKTLSLDAKFTFLMAGPAVHRCGRYPVSIDLYDEEGKKERSL